MTPQPDAPRLERPCPFCAAVLTYIGTDNSYSGDYEAEYWCDNCKERLHYVLPDASERAAMLRTVYRYFHAYGIANTTDRLVLDTAIEELTALGYTLTADETDWQPQQPPSTAGE
jgi:ABC-type sugar transport system substrate-binding protein